MLAASAARAEVQIERTYLPDAHASSFAFGLPGGVNFCYDPIRGGVNYAWTGGFLDITGVRPVNKLVTPAKPLGPVVYRESGGAPLRRGDATRLPLLEFKGYTLHDSSVELRYLVDGVLVREEIRTNPDRSGLIRKFIVTKSAGEKWWYVLDGLPPTLLTAESSGEFSIVDQFKQPPP
ncbi:MAG: hypothetical protein EXS32_12365 [Opitutus sp.]|nr:hypothetical protein [Opitutus sp.]